MLDIFVHWNIIEKALLPITYFFLPLTYLFLTFSFAIIIFVKYRISILVCISLFYSINPNLKEL